MNKDLLNFKINTTNATNGAAGGIAISIIPQTIMYIIATPNAQTILALFLPVLLAAMTYQKFKEKEVETKELVKKHKIKRFENPALSAFYCGLFSTQTFILFDWLSNDKNIMNFICLAISAGFTIHSTAKMFKIIDKNKQNIKNS